MMLVKLIFKRPPWSTFNLSKRFFSFWNRDEISKYIMSDREFKDLSVQDFKDLIRNENDEKIIEQILTEYEYIKYESGMVPSTLTIKQMEHLMQDDKDLPFSLSSLLRTEVIRSLARRSKEPFLIKQDDRPFLEHAIEYDNITGQPLYGSWRNSFFVRLRLRHVRLSLVSRAISASLFNPKLVLDCEYDYEPRYFRINAKNILSGIKFNYSYPDPFAFEVCGLKKSNSFHQYLESSREISLSFSDLVPFHETSFIDLYPKDKLIYLSPDGPEPLLHYNPDAIYIVGGIMDFCSSKRLSFMKAKKYNIPCYRFPIDHFFRLKVSHCLSVERTVNVIAHFRHSNDIRKSLDNIFSEEQKISIEESDEVQKQRLIRLSLKGKKSFRNVTDEILNKAFQT